MCFHSPSPDFALKTGQRGEILLNVAMKALLQLVQFVSCAFESVFERGLKNPDSELQGKCRGMRQTKIVLKQVGRTSLRSKY